MDTWKACPIQRINPSLNILVKCRIRPVGHPHNQAMLHRVDVAIFNVRCIIGFIPDEVVPKTALPYAPLPTGKPHRRTPFCRRQCLGKALLDDPPTVGIVIIPCGQCPHAMQMFRQNHPCINMERPAFPCFPHDMAEHVNMAYQQIVGMPLQQVHGEKISPTRHTVTAIIRHIGIEGLRDGLVGVEACFVVTRV